MSLDYGALMCPLDDKMTTFSVFRPCVIYPTHYPMTITCLYSAVDKLVFAVLMLPVGETGIIVCVVLMLPVGQTGILLS